MCDLQQSGAYILAVATHPHLALSVCLNDEITEHAVLFVLCIFGRHKATEVWRMKDKERREVPFFSSFFNAYYE